MAEEIQNPMQLEGELIMGLNKTLGRLQKTADL
jgi:hypothetical protein